MFSTSVLKSNGSTLTVVTVEVGLVDEIVEGLVDGRWDSGSLVCRSNDATVSKEFPSEGADGSNDGTDEGSDDGVELGTMDGSDDGIMLIDGSDDGVDDGSDDGLELKDGDDVGAAVSRNCLGLMKPSIACTMPLPTGISVSRRSMNLGLSLALFPDPDWDIGVPVVGSQIVLVHSPSNFVGT